MTKRRAIGDELVEAFEQPRDLEEGTTGSRVRVRRVAVAAFICLRSRDLYLDVSNRRALLDCA